MEVIRGIFGFNNKITFNENKPVLKNVKDLQNFKSKNIRAEDYPTPQKYIENPDQIPKYYAFQSNMVTDEDLQPGMLRQLEVDKRLTLPTRTHISFLITATDVIHSWSIPSLGIKADAIHGFMPIVIEAVSPEAYVV